MIEKDVPQDGIPSYGGRRKLFYAVDADGNYVTVPSSGWDAEAFATGSALDEIDRRTQNAWERAASGATSPLEYYMELRRMDVALLAAATGFSRWRVRRHFRPSLFARLDERVLGRYAEALGLGTDTLRRLTKRP